MNRLTIIKSEPTEIDIVEIFKENYDCHVCKEEFSSQKKLEAHVKKTHPGTKPYRCLICDTSLARMTSYKEHMNIHTGEKPHICTVCNEAFATGKSLNRHQEKHEQQIKQTFLNLRTKDEDPEDSESHITASAKIEEWYDCYVCMKKFSSQKKLESHVKKTHPGTKPYKCLICDTSLTRMTSYKEHMNIHTGEKPHKCTVCNEAFATGKSLNRHQEKHEQPNERKCLNCHTKFETWDDFENHTKTCITSVPSNARINDLVHYCNVCGMRFQHIKTLNEHMNTHRGRKPFACCWCQERFSNKKVLRRHILYHDQQNPRCCARCKKLFSDWSEFKKHTDDAVCKNSSKICIICQEKFTRLEDMETHYRINHPDAEKLYGCDEIGCEKRFCHKQLLLIHKRLHAKKKAKEVLEHPKMPGYDCPVCKTHIENYKNLIEHLKTHVEEQINETDITDAYSTKMSFSPKYEMVGIYDEYSNYGFRDTNSPQVKCEPNEPMQIVQTVIEDVNVKTEPNSFTIEPKIKVKKKSQVNRKRKKSTSIINEEHNKADLEPKQDDSSKKSKFECTVCGKFIVNERNFKVHCESHIKPQYECHHCGIRLSYHNSMRQHVLKHFEPKPFGCDVPDCQEKFRNMSDARAHVKAHRIATGRSRIHTCTICGKSFARKHVLNHHYKIHGDATLQCDQCPAVFKIVANWRKHMRTHTADKPFSCHTCGKCFKEKYYMLNHLKKCERKMNGFIEEKIPCSICGKSLSSKASLKVHLRTHTGQLPYSCFWQDCGLMFNSATALDKHRRQHTINY